MKNWIIEIHVSTGWVMIGRCWTRRGAKRFMMREIKSDVNKGFDCEYRIGRL